MLSAILAIGLAVFFLAWIWIDAYRAKKHAHR